MNKYELPVYKELVLSLKENRECVQRIIDELDTDIEFYETKIAEYEQRRAAQNAN